MQGRLKRPIWPRPGYGAPKPARIACGLSGRGRCGALPTAARTAPRSPDKGMAWRAGATRGGLELARAQEDEDDERGTCKPAQS